MKALITGGAGFIGSHLAEGLLAAGHQVLVIDDLSTGAMDNIASLKAHPKFDYVIEDIFKRSLLAEWVDRAEVIFHLAAAVGVRLIVDSPVRTIRTNIGGTEAVLSQAAKKSKKVLLASTSEIYGKAEKTPFSEGDDLVLGPTVKSRWSYAASKAVDEFLGLAYFKEKGLPVVIVRLFNTVGPRQTGRYGMVLPTFVRQALRGQPLTVFGDGRQSRCFSYVGDVVEALIGLAQLDRAVGQVYNLGSDQEISIMELAQLVKEMSGSASPIELIAYDQAYEEGFEDMQRRVPDLTKIKAALGYEPQTDIRGIVAAVIEYEKKRL
ncbi:MAG: GDP-mannose 4,6-dehydratase [Deltaproteobacteria bacterium]|nr:GDP-mannose 4,6-dehydratase [Deltaproteobacteria bacterium]